ncbi:hypothetical protein BDY17DRAFT_17733 [Neohortaea acidophila]|uniref:Homeobox domain-containing protein n=1 Tax=Neohortaea acidophila TaxID=245834 RepID=A0A6A6Q6W4_9PEZI|nr:uncharacterized protein BDY17DRAFT_17733 [Neohortaea acidophila]KAF2487769.1 hypothetical protein BDY17DRAFT_17733 [Neohortaea acidophila]
MTGDKSILPPSPPASPRMPETRSRTVDARSRSIVPLAASAGTVGEWQSASSYSSWERQPVLYPPLQTTHASLQNALLVDPFVPSSARRGHRLSYDSYGHQEGASSIPPISWNETATDPRASDPPQRVLGQDTEGTVNEPDESTAPRTVTVAELREHKRRSQRFRLTHSQTRYLMSEFAKQSHPDTAHRERLSREIPGLTPRQVQVWFQNRRAKMRRLTTDDQERMKRSRALPADFDMKQALHPRPAPPLRSNSDPAAVSSASAHLLPLSGGEWRSHSTAWTSLAGQETSGRETQNVSSAGTSMPYLTGSALATSSAVPLGSASSTMYSPPVFGAGHSRTMSANLDATRHVPLTRSAFAPEARYQQQQQQQPPQQQHPGSWGSATQMMPGPVTTPTTTITRARAHTFGSMSAEGYMYGVTDERSPPYGMGGNVRALESESPWYTYHAPYQHRPPIASTPVSDRYLQYHHTTPSTWRNEGSRAAPGYEAHPARLQRQSFPRPNDGAGEQVFDSQAWTGR